MNLGELIEAIGQDRYTAACVWAFSTAAGSGGPDDDLSPWPADLAVVPDELRRAIWTTGDASLGERLAVAQELYRAMPSYANTIGFDHFYEQFDAAAKEAFWAECRALLESEDDRLADPIRYALWVDFFANPSRVDEAWAETTALEDLSADARRIERVLTGAAKVPARLKQPLLERLGQDPRWRAVIDRTGAST